MTFPETGPTTMRIAGTFSKGSLINASYVMTMPDFAANVTSQLDGAILMNNAPGANPPRPRRTIEAALADYPNVTVNNPRTSREKAQDSVNQLLGIVTALLLLAVVVAILGIVNTLVLSVVERTRELGLLRAVGGTRRQVRTVVRRESVLMALLGARHRHRPRHGVRHRPEPGPRRRGHHHGRRADRDARALPPHRGRRGGARRDRTRTARQQGRRPACHRRRVGVA